MLLGERIRTINKKRLILTWMAVVVSLLSTIAHASATHSPADISPKSPSEFTIINQYSQSDLKGIKQYENKEYKTLDEYKQAYYEGKVSSMWLWMHMDRDNKITTINELKERFLRLEGVTIREPAEYYIRKVDEVVTDDPQAKNYHLKVVFRTLAVMSYDFDEGIDKEETAKRYLGPIYPAFKKAMEKKDKNE